MLSLQTFDPEIFNAIESEQKRQAETLNLIASENYTSRAVLEAQGSLLTDKYAEGYPQRRYYGGCVNIDEVEHLAIERAKELFHAEYANVQSHSGAQANMAAYLALIEPGDTILAMSLAHGGHLTHGDRVNSSGKFYKSAHYGVNLDTGRIDYPAMEKLAVECQPKLIIAGASAYSRTIDFERFRFVCDKIGARLMVDMAHIAGIIAAGLHPTPVPYADVVTSTTHKTMRGPRGGFILCKSEHGATIDSAVFPQVQGGPLMHAIAAKAVAFKEAMQPDFFDYQKRILDNAVALGEELKLNGLTLVSGGTDNHLVLVDLTNTGVTGRDAQFALEEAGIVANRNRIPFDKLPAMTTSGVRFGTPAVTTRGLGTEELKQTARLIVRIIKNIDDADISRQVKTEVWELCARFPVPTFSELKPV